MGQSSFLEAGTKFTGNMESGGSMRIEGTIDGNIECGKRIVLGKQACIKGSVRAKQIEVCGIVEGELNADSISLKAGCTVNGDIRCGQLASEQGAYFNGKCETKIPEKPTKAEQENGKTLPEE